jgi:hypothetical protein
MNYDLNIAKACADKAAFDEMRRAVEAAPRNEGTGIKWRDSLLDVPEQLSPRSEWLKRHNVTTHKCDTIWIAMIGPFPENIEELGSTEYAGMMMEYGTEDDAIVALAKERNWKLWSEK